MKLFYLIRVIIKKLRSKFTAIDSYCHKCGRNVYDFIAPDEVWSKINNGKDNGVFCYECFCEKCWEKSIYDTWVLTSIDKGDLKDGKTNKQSNSK